MPQKKPTHQQLLDLGLQPLIDKYGQNLASTTTLACIQHRMGWPYDAWDGLRGWRQLTGADIEMARHLLELFEHLSQNPEWR